MIKTTKKGKIFVSADDGLSAPTVQASDILFSNLTETSMKIDWTNGNGFARLVLVRQAGANTNPVDDTTYTANSVYGLGSQLGGNYVVFNGTGSTVTVTGLTAGLEYVVRILEYNGDPGTEKYNNSNSTNNPKTQYTLPALLSIQSHDITQDGVISGGSTTGSYIAGNGPYRLIVAKEGSPVDQLPVDGPFLYEDGGGTFGSGTDLGDGNYIINILADGVQTDEVLPFNISGIPSSPIHLRIFEFNVADGPDTYARYLTTTATDNPKQLN